MAASMHSEKIVEEEHEKPIYRRNFSTALALISPLEVRKADYRTVQPPVNSTDEIDSTLDAPLLSGSTLRGIPIDSHNFVKVVFFLLGLATLLPWNFYITANDYWMYKFRPLKNDVSDEDGAKTQYQTAFFSSLSVASNLPFLIVLYLSSFLNHRVPQQLRNTLSLSAVTILFGVTTVFVLVNTDSWQAEFFYFTMAIMVVLNVFAAWFQGGVMGLASLFPQKYMQITCVGMAVGGVFAALAQILTLLLRTSPTTSAIIYFLCALFVLAISLACFVALQRSVFFHFYTKSTSEHVQSQIHYDELDVKVSSNLVFRRIWPYALTNMMVFVVTLAIFPGYVAHTVSAGVDNGSLWTGRLFLPVTCFLLFNIGDFVGRVISAYIVFPEDRPLLLLGLSILRFIYIPLFMLCNVQPRRYLSVVFESDVWFVAFMTTFALSNGYLCAVSMMYAPKKVEYYLQEKVGTMMTAFLATGMTVGSFLGLFIVKIFFTTPS